MKTPPLTLNQLQELASRTLPERGNQHFFTPAGTGPFPGFEMRVDLIHAAFGLAGEVGELIDPIKKSMFYGKPLDVKNLREEAGDSLWYIAGPLCRALGCSLEDLARENVAKLQKRYPDRYTDEAAQARADKLPDDAPETYERTTAELEERLKRVNAKAVALVSAMLFEMGANAATLKVDNIKGLAYEVKISPVK